MTHKKGHIKWSGLLIYQRIFKFRHKDRKRKQYWQGQSLVLVPYLFGASWHWEGYIVRVINFDIATSSYGGKKEVVKDGADCWDFWIDLTRINWINFFEMLWFIFLWTTKFPGAKPNMHAHILAIPIMLFSIIIKAQKL